MNDNYLWDRSGKIDLEIKELEGTLGTLRYQPQPLRIPAHLKIGRRRRSQPLLVIAAAIALVAVVLGLWFAIKQRHPVSSLQATQEPPRQEPIERPQPGEEDQHKQNVAAPTEEVALNQHRHRQPRRDVLASSQTRIIRTKTQQPQLTPDEVAQKEQVLTALRLVSAKLTFAQRKLQGAPQLNPIRNQHKIG